MWQFPKAFYINIKLWRLFVVTNNLIPIEYYYLQKSVVQSSWLLLEEAPAEAARLLCRITGDLRLSRCFPGCPFQGPKNAYCFPNFCFVVGFYNAPQKRLLAVVILVHSLAKLLFSSARVCSMRFVVFINLYRFCFRFGVLFRVLLAKYCL